MEDTYNGWRNFETWLVALHLSNEYETQKYWEERAAAIKDKTDDFMEAKYMLGKEIEDDLEEYLYEAIPEDALLIKDLINASFKHIDFYEIAESYLYE